MEPDRLAEIEKRASKATPGPWESSCGRNEYAVVTQTLPYDSVWQVRYGGAPIAECDDLPNAAGNQDFIAHSREDIPWLIAEVRRLREELYESQKILFYAEKDSVKA